MRDSNHPTFVAGVLAGIQIYINAPKGRMLEFEFTACFHRYRCVRVSGTLLQYCRRETLRGHLNFHTGAYAFFTMFEFPPEFFRKPMIEATVTS